MPGERELERLTRETQAEEPSDEDNLGRIEELTDKMNSATEELKKEKEEYFTSEAENFKAREGFLVEENRALRKEYHTLKEEHRKLEEAFEREANRARVLEGQVLDLEQVIRSLKKRNEALENELFELSTLTAVETAPEEAEE